jgi:hypothetical protein
MGLWRRLFCRSSLLGYRARLVARRWTYVCGATAPDRRGPGSRTYWIGNDAFAHSKFAVVTQGIAARVATGSMAGQDLVT